MKKLFYHIGILLICFCCVSSAVSSRTGSQHSKQNPLLVHTPIDYLSLELLEDSSTFSITSPRCSAPIIVENDDIFPIQFTAESFTSVYAFISTAYEPIVDSYWLSLQSVCEQNGHWSVTASIPPVVPHELYNLTLLINRSGRLYSTTQPRAVSVTTISDTFTFIHITDFHVGDPRGFAESIRQTIGSKSILRCIHEINLLHPDFVIISGDLVFGQLYPKEYAREYPKLYEMLQRFDVPTYITPGNHDHYRRPGEDGQVIWESYFGPSYYSFDYGTSHFLAVNSYDLPARNRWAIGPIAFYWGGSIQDEQLNWITQDLQHTSNDQMTFMFLHHNPLWDTRADSLLKTLDYKNRPQLLSLIDAHDVDMVLAGHVHNDSINLVNDTVFITTTTPESEIRTPDGYWGYRMICIKDGTISSYNYKEPYYSTPSYQLQAVFKTQKKAVVTNDLEINTTVLLRFMLPDGSYAVSPGTVVMERSDGIKKELYVSVPMDPLSSITVQVLQDSLAS